MTIVDAIVNGYRDTLAAVTYGDGDLITLPATFTSGRLLSVLVTLSNDIVTVTDRGLSADELADVGVDIAAGRANRSFHAVRDSTGLPPMFGADEWEISVTADIADIAVAVQAVEDAAMRADGLRALSRSIRPVTFADQAVNLVGSRVEVVPKARMPGKHGANRQVTLSYLGNDEQPYYVQALSGGGSETRMRSYNQASGLFIGAEPQRSYRVALLQHAAWDGWQVENLRDICRVVDEDEVNDFVKLTAA